MKETRISSLEMAPFDSASLRSGRQKQIDKLESVARAVPASLCG